MRSDQGRPRRPHIPDFIPDDILRQYENDAQERIASQRRAVQSQVPQSRTRMIAVAIRRHLAKRHLLWALLSLGLCLLAPVIWLTTDPSSAGLFIVMSLLTTAGLVLLLRETTLWLRGHQNQLNWLLMEAGTRKNPKSEPD